MILICRKPLFSTQLPPVASTLGFVKADTDGASADAAFFDWMLKCEDILQNHTHEFTQYIHDMRYGKKGVTTIAPPVLPVLPPAPPSVDAGIQPRFTQKAAKAKANPACTKGIQEKLGIATVVSTVEHDTPDLSVKSQAGFPVLYFHKYEHTAINVYRDTDGKGYPSEPYKTLHKSHFIDKDLPAAGVTAVYKYKAVYLDYDVETGNFSPDVSITVVGR